MPTVDSRSIGITSSPHNRAYSDPTAWDSGATTVYSDDLIGNDVLWDGRLYYDDSAKIVNNSNQPATLGGSTSDDTRCKFLHAADGQAWYDLIGSGELNGEIAGAGLTFTSGTSGMKLTLAERGAGVEGIILAPTSTNPTPLLALNGQNTFARRCVMRSKGNVGASHGLVVVGASSADGQVLIQNILLIEGNSTTDYAIDLNAGNSGGTRTAYVLANLIARPSDLPAGNTAFRRIGAGRQVVIGNAVFGFNGLVSGTSGSIYTGSGYNATDAADGGTTATQLPFNADPGNGTNIYGLNFADQFVSTLAGSSGNWRLKAGHGLNFGVRITSPLNPAGLVVGGASQNAGTQDLDIFRNVRPTTTGITIGPIQDTSSGGGGVAARLLYLLNLMG